MNITVTTACQIWRTVRTAQSKSSVNEILTNSAVMKAERRIFVHESRG